MLLLYGSFKVFTLQASNRLNYSLMTKFFQIDHACKTKITQDNVIMNKQKCEVGLASLALSHIFLPSPKQFTGQIFTKCDFLAHLI